MTDGNNNGWNEWSKYVLKELERLNNCYSSLDKKTTDMQIDLVKRMDTVRTEINNKLSANQNEITSLKVKSGIWGVLGGAIPVLIGLGVWLLKSGAIK